METQPYLLTFESAQDYLRVPRVYADFLGGLRWSGSEDGLVDSANRMFAFSEAIAEFLDGFASQPHVISFGYLLHWIDLLQNRRQTQAVAAIRLHHAFCATCRSWRFAGVLAANLCADVPGVPSPPDLAKSAARLRDRAFPIRWFVSQFPEMDDAPAMPPIAPEAFEELILHKLKAYSDDDLRIWLRTGRGPIRAANQLTQEMPMPRSLARVLAALIDRPRLAGAQHYVTQLVGALTLPPRRFVPQELPVGGYTDIVTRGQVEQLLPTQFALDEMEFLRRFAEKELLYFRREEPPVQNRQELVVLLDQGVRTWGDVRLVLAAAAIAFGKQAMLRKTPFFLAATSNAGAVVDPLQTDEEALGDLIEASDLSLNPGLALERVLETPCESPRDVVLLTHPRSLREEDVRSAARRLGAGDRLFGVALDAKGQAEISEIRRGTPIKVRQFHVDFATSQPPPRQPIHREVAPGTPWTGDVEAIPFPFRFGTEPHIKLFDFDYAGEWLVTVSGQGSLHLWKLDGSVHEMLPRPYFKKTLTQFMGMIGVQGGFAVAGLYENQVIVAHYDVARRHCSMYLLEIFKTRFVDLFYIPQEHHVMVADRYNEVRILIDLDVEKEFPADGFHLPERTRMALTRVTRGNGLASNRRLANSQFRSYRPTEGTVEFISAKGDAYAFTPMANGKPCFRNVNFQQPAQLAGTTLAVCAKRTDIGDSITLLRVPEGVVVREYPLARSKYKIIQHLLSFGGERIALVRSDHRVEVEHIFDRSVRNLVTRVGGFPMEASMTAGADCLILHLGKGGLHWHLFDWSSGTLEHFFERDPMRTRRVPGSALEPGSSRFFGHAPLHAARAGDLPSWCAQDPDRFRAGVRRGRLWYVIDRFGQVAVLDHEEKLIAMFAGFRDHFAAWMPDGTRFGRLTLSLGPPTSQAAQRIARALLDAAKIS